jgi:hypothetical protein
MLTYLIAILLLSNAIASSVPTVRSGIKPKKRPAARLKGPRWHRLPRERDDNPVLQPQVFIISMYDSQRDVWDGIPGFDLLAQNITVPGFSPLFPDVHCTSNESICQMTTSKGEINAAASVMALWMSDLFGLRSTYFLIAGVGGVNPHLATTGSVTFSRYAVPIRIRPIPDPLQRFIRLLPSKRKLARRTQCPRLSGRDIRNGSLRTQQ